MDKRVDGMSIDFRGMNTEAQIAAIMHFLKVHLLQSTKPELGHYDKFVEVLDANTIKFHARISEGSSGSIELFTLKATVNPHYNPSMGTLQQQQVFWIHINVPGFNENSPRVYERKDTTDEFAKKIENSIESYLEYKSRKDAARSRAPTPENTRFNSGLYWSAIHRFTTLLERVVDESVH